MRVPLEVTIVIKYFADENHFDGNLEDELQQSLLEGEITLDEFTEIANIERVEVNRVEA